LAAVKQWVASKNTAYKIKEFEQLCRRVFKEVRQQEWENICQQVERIQQLYYEQKGIVEDPNKPVKIGGNGVDISDESSNMSETEGLPGMEELEEDQRQL
jgi:hypothetical protein